MSATEIAASGTPETPVNTVRDGYEFVGMVNNGYTIVEERPDYSMAGFMVVLGINYGRSYDRYVVWHAEKSRDGKRVNFSGGDYTSGMARAATVFMQR